jgi:hypothetical protein
MRIKTGRLFGGECGARARLLLRILHLELPQPTAPSRLGPVEQGDDLTRLDSARAAAALAVEPGGRLAAVGPRPCASTPGASRARRPPTASVREEVVATKTGPVITLGDRDLPLITGEPRTAVAVLRFEASGSTQPWRRRCRDDRRRTGEQSAGHSRSNEREWTRS